ncbi:hypothetical protein IQ07DRAFT_481935, partial [Pyrenochaeta sp. DS3sAY3a]
AKLKSRFHTLLDDKRSKNVSRPYSRTGGSGGEQYPRLENPDSRPSSRASLSNPPFRGQPFHGSALTFRNLLVKLSEIPLEWENQKFLDEAVRAMPIKTFEHRVAFERELNPNPSASWGYKDYLILALLRWFKEEFFQLRIDPLCTRCKRLSEEREFAPASFRAELYQCPTCDNDERVLTWSNPVDLLRSRHGQSEEWAICFGLLCRALRCRVRYVWNNEGYHWNEVFSEYANRWVHVDSTRAAWDQPEVYTQVLNEKLSYCIAFSVDGAVDVTLRYVRLAEHAAPRTRSSMIELLRILDGICTLRRKSLDEEERYKLERENSRERNEFVLFIVSALLSKLLILRIEDV